MLMRVADAESCHLKLRAAAGAAADGLIEIVERLGEHSQGVLVENPLWCCADVAARRWLVRKWMSVLRCTTQRSGYQVRDDRGTSRRYHVRSHRGERISPGCIGTDLPDASIETIRTNGECTTSDHTTSRSSGSHHTYLHSTARMYAMQT